MWGFFFGFHSISLLRHCEGRTCRKNVVNVALKWPLTEKHHTSRVHWNKSDKTSKHSTCSYLWKKVMKLYTKYTISLDALWSLNTFKCPEGNMLLFYIILDQVIWISQVHPIIYWVTPTRIHF